MLEIFIFHNFWADTREKEVVTIMENTAELKINGASYQFPIVEGSERERGIDISALRNQTGCITLDDGYGNTGSCKSAITFIDGEKGILRYRGIPI